jgi:cation diffusion facilitator CzcD-associated flavoprotein CzcO
MTLRDSPIYGENGVSLDDVWDPEPVAYMSMCPAKMPNFFLFVGPNGAPGAGSTIQMSECAAEYMIKCIRKLQRENIRSMVVKYVWRSRRNRVCAKHNDSQAESSRCIYEAGR